MDYDAFNFLVYGGIVLVWGRIIVGGLAAVLAALAWLGSRR